MAATATSYRVVTDPSTRIATQEVDVQHLPTDSNATVKAAADARIKISDSRRGTTGVFLSATYAHTTFLAGSTSMRISTLRYTRPV